MPLKQWTVKDNQARTTLKAPFEILAKIICGFFCMKGLEYRFLYKLVIQGGQDFT